MRSTVLVQPLLFTASLVLSCQRPQTVAYDWLTSDASMQDAGTFAPSVEQPQVLENDPTAQVVLTLPAPAVTDTFARYELHSLQAQSECQNPDFAYVSGEVAFRRGEQTAVIDFPVLDDALAELDETLELVFTSPPELEGQSITLTIIDDDRKALIDASTFDVNPMRTEDQTLELQAAIDFAALQAPSVVVVTPGEYLVSSLSVKPGVTLSGRGVTFERGPNRPAAEITLHVSHSGDTDGLPVVIEGLTLDGNRDEQGPFENHELNGAHLISVEGDVAYAGRARAVIEGVVLRSSTASGINVGPNSKVDVCRVQATDLFRESVGILGGHSELDVVYLTASATLATSGIRINPLPEGYAGSLTQNVKLREVQLLTGDFEGELTPDSELVMDAFRMAQPPFRLSAEGANVTISNSRIVVGVPSPRHNTVSGLGGTTIVDSTLVASEWIDEKQGEEEATRRYGMLHFEPAANQPQTGALTLRRCRFETEETIDADDTVYVVDAPQGDPVTNDGSTLDEGFEGWFMPP